MGLNDNFIPAYINLGSVVERMGAPDLAVAQWSAAVEKLNSITGLATSHKVTALNQMARVLERQHQDARAEEVMRQPLELDPHQRQVIQHFVALRQRQCEWPIVVR